MRIFSGDAWQDDEGINQILKDIEEEEKEKKEKVEGPKRTARALEIQKKNPKINPKEAALMAKKEFTGSSYSVGDKKVINGITYIRNESGQWLPQ